MDQADGAYCMVYKTGRLSSPQSFKGHFEKSSYKDNLKWAGDVQYGRLHNLKTGRQRIRWNLVFNLILFGLVPLPFWLPRLFPTLDQRVHVFQALIAIQGLFQFFWITVSILAITTVFILIKNRNKNFLEEIKKDIKMADRYTKLEHVVVLSCYKEPLSLIKATVQTLANQSMAKKVTVVISLEDRTPFKLEKQAELCDIFGGSFREIIFTVHPYLLEGEIPGKCSNANCGIRTAMGHLSKRLGDQFNSDNVLVTTCDADSIFHPKFIEALTFKFLSEADPNSCLFQAPLLYNWNLDSLSFFTRTTGLLRAFLMMGALIPLNINTMSIFSFSATLCISGDFIHPAYQMDDIIALIRWMGVAKKRIKISLVPVPLISGPTSGRVIEEEFEEWARQARRWTIGAAEVFHYFVAKAKNIPAFTALSWGIKYQPGQKAKSYIGVILCCSGLYSVTLSVALTTLFGHELPQYVRLCLWASLGFQYLVFGLIFILDRITIRLTVPRIVERISLVRQIFQLALAPFVLLLYSLVELYALTEVMVKGKEVCKHGASKKDDLKV